MSNLNNRVQLEGRLGDNFRVIYDDGKNGIIADANIAVDDSYKNSKGEKIARTDWFRIKVFGKTAKNAMKFTKKGSRILLCGKLCIDVWEKDGEDKTSTYVEVHEVRFLDKK